MDSIHGGDQVNGKDLTKQSCHEASQIGTQGNKEHGGALGECVGKASSTILSGQARQDDIFGQQTNRSRNHTS